MAFAVRDRTMELAAAISTTAAAAGEQPQSGRRPETSAFGNNQTGHKDRFGKVRSKILDSAVQALAAELRELHSLRSAVQTWLSFDAPDEGSTSQVAQIAWETLSIFPVQDWQSVSDAGKGVGKQGKAIKAKSEDMPALQLDNAMNPPTAHCMTPGLITGADAEVLSASMKQEGCRLCTRRKC